MWTVIDILNPENEEKETITEPKPIKEDTTNRSSVKRSLIVQIINIHGEIVDSII